MLQLDFQGFVKVCNMYSVYQCVIAQYGDRDQSAVVLPEIPAPGDAGIAVGRRGDGLGEVGVGKPGKRGDEDFVRGVLIVFCDASLLFGVFLCLHCVGQIPGKWHAAVQCTVAVGLVFQRDGVGGSAVVKFDDAVTIYPLAKFRNAVGSPRYTVAEGEEERKILLFDSLCKFCDVDVDGEPYIGVGKAVEIVEVVSSFVAVHVDASVIQW